MTTSALMTDDALKTRSKKAADAAVDRVMGEKVSPAMREAASEAVSPWAERFVRALDDFVRIPGTKLGVGLDPILGFVLPGAGDAITGTGSIGLLFLALRERVPTVVLLRMVVNILVDTVGGLLPFLGDAFDLVWRSNRRNLDLIEKYKDDPKAKATWVDYLVVVVGLGLAVLSIVIPIFVIYGLGLGALLGIGSLFGE